ncbi:neuroglian-like [Babylonia areolata]|uniref:neuroglian-like n=1 Tax=Babylonia areolata TaxID=304850 RepID=UPI003FD2E917
MNDVDREPSPPSPPPDTPCTQGHSQGSSAGGRGGFPRYGGVHERRGATRGSGDSPGHDAAGHPSSDARAARGRQTGMHAYLGVEVHGRVEPKFVLQVKIHPGRYVHIEDQLQNVEVLEGERAKFVCKVKIHPLDEKRLKVQWKHNGEFLDLDLSRSEAASGRHVYKAERNRHALIIKNTRLKDTGVYTCMASVGLDTDMSVAHLLVKGQSVSRPPGAPRKVEVAACVGSTAQLRWEEGQDHGAPIARYIVQFNTSDTPDRWHDYFEQFPAGARQPRRRANIDRPSSPSSSSPFGSGRHHTVYRGSKAGIGAGGGGGGEAAALLSKVRLPDGAQHANIELSPWGTYAFRVKAVSELGVSKPSHVTARTCTTPPERPDTNPKNVRTRTDVRNTLVIEWNPIERLHFNGPGFRYLVKWRRKGSLAWESATVEDPEQTVFRQEVKDVYGLYEVQVKAQNDMGLSHQPAFVYIGRSGESEPIVSPKDFRLNPNHPPESHKAYFIWEAVNTSAQLINGKFCGYKLRYWKSVEGRHKQKEVEFVLTPGQRHGPDMRVSVLDLPAYTALRAQVAVMNTHYTGPPSQTIDFFTPEGTPSSVRELHVEAYGVGYVLLKWLPPDQPNGILEGYDIAYQHISGLKVGKLKGLSPQINSPSTLGARISGLKSDHQYRFYVWARTSAGRGHSAYTDIRTLRGKLPDPPKLLVAEVVNSSINLTWQADQAPDTHYLLEYRQDGYKGWWTTDYIWNKSWVLLDRFDPISDYEVRLLARNRLGDMSTSSILKFSNQRQGGSYYFRLDGHHDNRINGAINWKAHWWWLGPYVIFHFFLTLVVRDTMRFRGGACPVLQGERQKHEMTSVSAVAYCSRLRLELEPLPAKTHLSPLPVGHQSADVKPVGRTSHGDDTVPEKPSSPHGSVTISTTISATSTHPATSATTDGQPDDHGTRPVNHLLQSHNSADDPPADQLLLHPRKELIRPANGLDSQ